MPKRSRIPKDAVQNALRIVETATGESLRRKPARKTRKNPHAVALGRKGGLKGGASRAAKLTPERRTEIARLAAQSRWKKQS